MRAEVPQVPIKSIRQIDDQTVEVVTSGSWMEANFISVHLRATGKTGEPVSLGDNFKIIVQAYPGEQVSHEEVFESLASDEHIRVDDKSYAKKKPLPVDPPVLKAYVKTLNSKGDFNSILIDMEENYVECLRDREVEKLLKEYDFENRVMPHAVKLPFDHANYRVVFIKEASQMNIYLITR